LSEYKTREETEQSDNSMAVQLGTSLRGLANLEFDELKLMFLVGSDQLPNQAKTVAYRFIRLEVVENGLSFDAAVCKVIPKVFDAIRGRGQNNVLRAENARHGVPTQPEVAPEKPSILDRVMDADKVREYERWKERKDLELE